MGISNFCLRLKIKYSSCNWKSNGNKHTLKLEKSVFDMLSHYSQRTGFGALRKKNSVYRVQEMHNTTLNKFCSFMNKLELFCLTSKFLTKRFDFFFIDRWTKRYLTGWDWVESVTSVLITYRSGGILRNTM